MSDLLVTLFHRSNPLSYFTRNVRRETSQTRSLRLTTSIIYFTLPVLITRKFI